MVRQYRRTELGDLSPVMSPSETEQAAAAGAPMQFHVRVVSGRAGGPCRSVAKRAASGTYSPLVAGGRSFRAGGGSSTGGSVAASQMDVTLAVTDATTVEDLARAIEQAQHEQREDGAGFACAAVFRGGEPLQFTQRVRRVLESGASVMAYGAADTSCNGGGGGWSSSDSDGDSAVIDYAQASGSGCVFVPLTESLALGEAGPRVSKAVSTAAASVSNVDMTRVGQLIARAALKVRFINVLVTPALLRAFLGFCALPSELALESLLFVLDVERFRHVQPSMARLLANYIYLSYIAPQAPLRINTSRMMRDRIPWPFLPGWEHNPWIFDEVLASVGFTLKKHTLLRFERSPVGLRALMDAPNFDPDAYVAPLRFDGDSDPMAAIAAQFEPDIDVVIWVNELQADAHQMLAGLAALTVAFREQLLQRVAAQFVDAHHALCLCDGYFRLASHIAPLQKQRKIKKTRKLRSFFGDNPHEALLRQQLMAVVPPSSHVPAARAAAELVARKRTAEARLRSTDRGGTSGSGSATSSLIAEQQLMGVDSDSDVEDEHLRAWAHDAMRRPSTSDRPLQQSMPSQPPRERSWSDSDTDDDGASDGVPHVVNGNGWTTDEEPAPPPEPEPQPQLPPRNPALHRVHCVYNDQALSRALSMIGAPNYDSQDSASSDAGSSSSTSSPHRRRRRRGLDDPLARMDAATAAAAAAMDPHSFSVYTTHSSMSLGRATRGSRFERKRRADKLREFFGRADPGADEQLPPAAAAAVAAASAMSSIPSLPLRGVSLADAPLSAEQRNILVRRRRKLKALLGEQVEESVISLAPAVCPDTARSSASSQADVPFCVPELDGSACSLLTPEHTSQASSAGMSADAPPSAAPDAARQRAQRLRRFFGQSLNSEAMLMQGVAHSGSPALTDESFDIVPNAPADGAWPPFCASEGSAPLLLQEDPPVRAQFWVTDSPESQESVLTDEGAGPRSSLLKALRAHKASIIGSIRRPTPSMQPSARSRTSTQSSLASSTTGSQRNSAVATPSPGKLAMLARKIKPWPDAEQPVAMPPPPPPLAVARLVDDARSQPLVPPVRSSSIKPLSPLPGISPNNLQASIDRFIPPAMPQTVAFPPRVSSAAHADDHRQLVTAALLGAAPPGTRARRSNSAKARVTKSVHWFDSPDNAPELPLPPPPPDSAPPSAKTSLESSMAIVLRSPSTKRPAVKSPLVSPRTVASTVPARSRFPTLPIGSPTSGPRLLLSHKASISAVGGRLLQGGAERTRPAVSGSFSNGNGAAGSGGIVTIRARRSASFIVNRRLERATVGRKRSNTIGTGRQADAPSELRPPPPDDPNDIPRADKETRRVQSVILPAQYRPPEPPVTRGRCATVIPLHVELQQMLERRIAAAVERRTAPRRLRSPRMSDLVPMTAANKQQAEESLMQSLAMAANALCIASPLAPAAVVPPPPPPVRNAPSVGRSGPPRVKPAGRRLSIQLDVRPRKLTAATAAPVPLGRLRSNSCPARFVPLRKCSPIQPAIARYLQSAKAGQTRRNTKRMSGSYQRISMAMLARQHSIPRRSLDQRVVHKRKLSPYMESSVRKFGSLGSSSLRPPPGGK